MKNNYSNSAKDRLSKLKENLRDVELEKKMTFEQSGLHLWSNEVSDQFSEFDEEIEMYKRQIKNLQGKNK